MSRSAATRTWRFSGRIAGWGTTAGVRFVLGNWHTTPLGPFAGCMIQHPDGQRRLLAPSAQVAEFVSATYEFDVVDTAGVRVQRRAPRGARGGPGAPAPGRVGADPPARSEDRGTDRAVRPAAAPKGDPAQAGGFPVPAQAPTTAGETWQISAGPLSATLRVGRRPPLGWLLRAMPARLASAPWFTILTDPIARVLLPGVRTRGTAGGGRTEYYGATDLHHLTSATTTWDGHDLGPMTPIDPPVQFGFASAPRRPSVTDLITTVREAAR